MKALAVFASAMLQAPQKSSPRAVVVISRFFIGSLRAFRWAGNGPGLHQFQRSALRTCTRAVLLVRAKARAHFAYDIAPKLRLAAISQRFPGVTFESFTTW